MQTYRQPKYKHASVDYVMFVRVFLEQKTREYILHCIDEDTREFLRFVAEPNAHKESRAYQNARTQIVHNYHESIKEDTYIEDKVFSNKPLSVIFHYYAELFKGISNELFVKDLSECIKTDTIVPIESYLKHAIVHNAMEFDKQLEINHETYFDYLDKSRTHLSIILPSFDYKIKNVEDLEIYALCLINEGNVIEIRNSSPVKTIGENMAI
jgi:hypothetical protein